MKNQFKNENHYKRYLYAVSLGKQINEHLVNGCIIFDEDNQLFTEPFVFEDANEPCIMAGNVTYLCNERYEDSNLWYMEFRNEIKKFFSGFRIVEQKDIKKLKL